MRANIKCPYCPRTFEGEGKKDYVQGRVKANLANHMKSAHPEHYKPSAAAIARNANKSGIEQFLVATKPRVGFDDNVQVEKSGDQITVKTKRPYHRQPKLVKSSDTVCFCPKCGCNIRAVQVAMGI